MAEKETVVLDTVLKTIEQLAPALVVGAAVANPSIAAAVKIAPLALQLLHTATLLTKVGGMTTEQLEQLFAQVSQNVQATHEAWAALNQEEQNG